MRFLIILSLVFLYSCSSKNDDVNSKNTKLAIEGTIDAEIASIEAEILEKGQVATSLRYTQNDDIYVVVNAHFNEAGKIIKIEEEYSEGANKNTGKNSYYLKDEKIIATREYFSEFKPTKSSFIDRISYYEKEKAVKTKAKIVDFEEDLEKVAYQEVDLVSIKIDRAKRVLNQQGEFENTFQGFIKVGPLYYITIGSKNSEGYVSTLRVDYEDEFITKLLNDQEKYFNRKIFVNFENVVDPTGMQYQKYISGNLLD